MVKLTCKDGVVLEAAQFVPARKACVRKTSERSIPAFSSSGARMRNYSHESAKRLISLKLVASTINKRGMILAIEFLPGEGATENARRAPHSGTKYSFLERITDASRCWKLRPSESI